jgi:pimeloyl-ACP methyl ester carboxylesterase
VPIFEGQRARRDVVTFDQRAAGISSDMVTCFSTFENSLVELFQPAKLDSTKIEEIFGKCTGELKANGRNLSAYNTVENAKDVRAVMQALGYGDYNNYGIFYGTKLALEVMRSAPAGARLLVIDSVFPPNARAVDTIILPVQEGVLQVITQCAADAACAATFPDHEAPIQHVVVKLEKNPIPAARGRPEINVGTLISLFEDRNAYGHWPNTTCHMPLIVTEWDRGEPGTNDRLASGTTARARDGFELLKPFADKMTPDRATLRARIEAHLPSADIVPTLALLDALSDGDLAEVFAAVSKEARTICKLIVDMPDPMVVACTEDVPVNTREQMQSVVDGLKFRFLAKSDTVNDSLYPLCPFIPPALPFPGFHDAVKSDIPTLVMYVQRHPDLDRRGSAGRRGPEPRDRPGLSRSRTRRAGLFVMRQGYRSGFCRTTRRALGDRLHRDAEARVHPALRLISQPVRSPFGRHIARRQEWPATLC